MLVVASVLATLLLFSNLSLLLTQEPPNSAYIIASKRILNTQIAEGRDITIFYGIYNIGMKTAYDINLIDDSFENSTLTFITGLTDVTWAEIPPESNVTHTIILKPPLDAGSYLNFSSALITYKHSREDAVSIEVTTSSPRLVRLMGNAEYSRKFEAHYMDWVALAIMILPTLAIPFGMFYHSQSRYATNKAKSH